MVEVIEKELVLKEQTVYEQKNIARNWINGEWLDSEKQGTSFNPATGEPIGRYADGGQPEAELAVASALKAFQ